ncbi:SRPBCC family protein [Bacillus salipaludis]|uniref:SRPBCC family protein n=1 Tax=Bacillus salipaludis TaxID=2547811 RepID=UPI002E1B70C4|nr:SRPBCC family protein [Bacillus salipaludis]
MVDVRREIIINSPIDKVARFAGDPDNAPKWYVNIRSVEWKTPKPLICGSKIAFKAEFLGRQLEYTYEIAEYISGQKLVMRTAQGPFPMETTYTWEKLDTVATRMTLRNAGNPSGFSKIFAPIMGKMMKRENQKDLQRLKNILET